jgi:HSP20 family molecular chaperone IbpA
MSKPNVFAWADAIQLLDRADRLHRRFFTPGRAAPDPCWEPPLDVIETETGIFVELALPGVAPDQVEVAFMPAGLRVTAKRPPPAVNRRVRILSLELPYGRFEREIRLPRGHYELVERELTNGCLRLTLRKRV